MVTLTTHQLILVAFFGGLFAAMSVLGLVLAWKAALWLTDQLLHGHETLRDRRKHLQICRAIEALGTTDHPTE